MDEETFVKGHKLPVTRGVSSRESKVQQGDYQCVLSHFRHVRLCDPMDLSLPGSSVHGILQARTLEWVAISSSRGIFLTQGSSPCPLFLLYRQAGSL